MLKMMNAEHLATVASLKTDEVAGKDDLEALEQVDEVVKRMNEFYKKRVN